MHGKTSLERTLNRRIGRAVRDFNLIEDKDRILVAVSGGKDSLVLLRLLAKRQSYAPVHFELLAATVESEFLKLSDKQKRRLKKLCETLNVPIYFKEIKLGMKKTNSKEENCFWCAWNRRKTLFELAKENGCNKVALAHNKDDLTQTALLNLFFQAEVKTMLPNQELFKGKLRIIRPLIYAEEKEIEEYAKEVKLRPIRQACPIARQSQRLLMQSFIKKALKASPHAKNNILKALLKH